MTWNHVYTLSRLGGVALINVYKHMMVLRRFSFPEFMFEVVQPLTKIMVFFIQKIYIMFEKRIHDYDEFIHQDETGLAN